jgi:hypothetical protein
MSAFHQGRRGRCPQCDAAHVKDQYANETDFDRHREDRDQDAADV